MILQAAVLGVFLCCVHSFTIQDSSEKGDESSGNNNEDEDLGISTLLEKANVNVGKNFDDPLVMYGDIAVPDSFQNADPCTARGCLWPKATDGNVYVPYRISNQYFVGVYRKLKKLLQRRKSDLDSKQEEALNKTLLPHKKDHILGPFVGLSPEYMEMSIWYNLLRGLSKVAVIVNAFVISFTSDFIPIKFVSLLSETCMKCIRQ